MLSVEECLAALEEISFQKSSDTQPGITNTWDRRFVSDIAGHVGDHKPISTGQASIVLKLIARYRAQLVNWGIDDHSIGILLQTPYYQVPPYPSTQLPREVRWIGDSKLAFRCKYNAAIVEDLKKLKGINPFLAQVFPTFNREHSLWYVDVNAGNLDRVMDVIKRHRFGFDDTVAMFFHEASNSQNKPSGVELTPQGIEITTRDDAFLDMWLNTVVDLEQ